MFSFATRMESLSSLLLSSLLWDECNMLGVYQHHGFARKAGSTWPCMLTPTGALLCHWCVGEQCLHQKEHEGLWVYILSLSLTAEHLLKVFVLLCACSGSVVQAQLPNILTKVSVVDVFKFCHSDVCLWAHPGCFHGQFPASVWVEDFACECLSNILTLWWAVSLYIYLYLFEYILILLFQYEENREIVRKCLNASHPLVMSRAFFWIQ